MSPSPIRARSLKNKNGPNGLSVSGPVGSPRACRPLARAYIFGPCRTLGPIRSEGKAHFIPESCPKTVCSAGDSAVLYMFYYVQKNFFKIIYLHLFLL